MRTSALLMSILVCACKKGTDVAPPAAASSSAPVAAITSAAPPNAPTAAVTAPATAAAPTDAGVSAIAGARTWTFESDKAGSPPAGFAFGRTGEGREGKWEIRADGGSNVLAQSDADGTDYRFPVAWATEPKLKDLELKVRCKPVSGKVDQACGLVFRLRDANNYYLTRANALENNVRLYIVKDGKRQQIASYNGKVTGGTWHDYKVVAKGNHIEVHWDGAKVLDHHDGTFGDAGMVGVWTKADSVTYFDDLSVTRLE